MNKLILTVGLVGSMLTPNEIKRDGTLVDNRYLSESIGNIQDMKEWMKQDIENGDVPEGIGITYIHWLNQTEDMLIYHSYTLHITDEKQ